MHLPQFNLNTVYLFTSSYFLISWLAKAKSKHIALVSFLSPDSRLKLLYLGSSYMLTLFYLYRIMIENCPTIYATTEGTTNRTHPCSLSGGKWGSQQFDGFLPQPCGTIITKHVNSAFIGTDFKDTLEKDGIKTLIVTGVATNVCCESTIRDGAMLGFCIIVPRDCVGAYTRETHEWSLAQIDVYWGWVTTSEEIIAAWRK